MRYTFDKVAQVPSPGDNVAIASHRMEAGTCIVQDGRTYFLSHTILEGHRFAHLAIPKGQPLLSWSLPFGMAVRDIAPGHYVCNVKMLDALQGRQIDFELPTHENFVDHRQHYEFDEDAVHVGEQVAPYTEPRFFDGYARGPRRGVGTRNFIVLLGTSSLTGSYVRALADRFKDVGQRWPNIDGVVALAHTEGGERTINNLNFVLRALSGFVMHPNVAAILAVDFGDEAVNNVMLKRFLAEHDEPLDSVLHGLLSLNTAKSLAASLDEGETVVRGWLEPVNRYTRSRQSAEHLKLALQCGGSDAFSGICGNPLAGWVAKQIIRCGGSANLAETDELIGAESYVLANVRDADVARTFLDKIETFLERAGWHGHDAEGNTSAGNRFRGLYNIVIKSIGAARKKLPEVRLDHVIDYGQRMHEPGFYFMDSPGNDLESVAGQVAAGSNLILFTTGNGSITNFPFVPTIKIITTTDRYNMIRSDMDVNAGRFQDSHPMAQLGAETFALAQRIASGQHSAGEKAGHAQVQIWRNWHQTDASHHAQIHSAAKPTGQPLATRSVQPPQLTFLAYRTTRGYAADQVGAVMPTSLCSSQVARMIVERLNELDRYRHVVSRFVTFMHTEGCGVSSGDNEQLFVRTLIGHMAHRLVRYGLFLEHGCEKTHNDAMCHALISCGLDPKNFGWASVQLDGGIDRVTHSVIDWFDRTLSGDNELRCEDVDLGQLRMGLTAVEQVSEPVAAALAHLAATVATAGGLVVLPQNASLLKCGAFVNRLLRSATIQPTLAYGQRAQMAGLHVMETPTAHAAETMTGLGATGVEVMLAHVTNRPLQSHPMIPLIQCSSGHKAPDMDFITQPQTAAPASIAMDILELVLRVASRRYIPKLFAQRYTDFQMTRGLLGVSL